MKHLMKKKHYLLNLVKIGNKDLGFISLIEGTKLMPFPPKRIYWIYDSPNGIERGGHYHHKLEQIIVCVSGKLTILLENINGEKIKFILDDSSKALYLPSKHWRDITFENNAVLLCIASDVFDEKDYLRNYDRFKKIKQKV